MAELQETGSLSHPRLELSTTAPLVGDRAGVCLFLSQPFTPFTPDPSLSLSLLVPYQRLFAQRPSFWEVLEKPARGIYQEDNVQKSSLQSFYISDSVFLHKQIQRSTASSAQGKCQILILQKTRFLLQIRARFSAV